MNKVLIGGIAIVLLAGGAYTFANNQKQAAMAEQKMMEEKMLMEQETMEEKEMMEKEAVMQEEMMKDDSVMMDKDVVGMYEEYSADKLARAEMGDVVLFFHASWCPSCRGLDANLKQNQANIPAGVSILKLDYDTETALKQKYGVTTQHTLVQVDAGGNLIKKWSGGGNLDSVLAQIQ